jgi:hypothetical protein
VAEELAAMRPLSVAAFLEFDEIPTKVLGPTLSKSELLAFLEMEPAIQAMSMARPA